MTLGLFHQISGWILWLASFHCHKDYLRRLIIRIFITNICLYKLPGENNSAPQKLFKEINHHSLYVTFDLKITWWKKNPSDFFFKFKFPAPQGIFEEIHHQSFHQQCFFLKYLMKTIMYFFVFFNFQYTHKFFLFWQERQQKASLRSSHRLFKILVLSWKYDSHYPVIIVALAAFLESILAFCGLDFMKENL